MSGTDEQADHYADRTSDATPDDLLGAKLLEGHVAAGLFEASADRP